jgi:hypothetical protein
VSASLLCSTAALYLSSAVATCALCACSHLATAVVHALYVSFMPDCALETMVPLSQVAFWKRTSAVMRTRQ